MLLRKLPGWQGFDKDVKMKAKRPEYRAGQHFGDGNFDSDEEDDDDDEVEKLAARGVNLAETASEVFEAESVVLNPLPDYSRLLSFEKDW